MDSFEVNKLIGAFLGTVFIVFSISLASDAIFAAHPPAQPGYAIEAAEPAEGAAGPAAEEAEPIAVRLASADPEAGAAVFRKCTACHTAEQGGANKVGPNLWDIVNRPIASHEGFSYSGAMREFSEGGQKTWTYEHLAGFLAAPRSYISGTAMAFAGIKNPQEEANLIAYLRSLSDNPAPLPEAPSEEESAAAPAENGAAAEESAPTEEAAPAEKAAPAEEAPAEEPAPASD
jgi:cytochrome c